MTTFIPGLQLSELFFHEAVKPILAASFPGLCYSAGLLGPGSEVIGFDTARSTDHNWGPRVFLFLTETDFVIHDLAIRETLRNTLPRKIHGYPTNFGESAEAGTLVLQQSSSGPINHQVKITTIARFLRQQLGIDSCLEVSLADWLTFPEQSLLELTNGKVFYDGLGELHQLRAAFDYYPRDLWLYLLTTQWARIAQQEPFVGRCGDIGDDLGSALIAASLVRDLMRLGFLMERTYAPYSKWLGTAFARLTCATRLLPVLECVVRAQSWQERETHLCRAYSIVAAIHNELGITDLQSIDVAPFHDRPYLVIDAGRFSEAIRATIVDDRVRRLPRAIGSIDQYVDSTDVLGNADIRVALRAIYGIGS